MTELKKLSAAIATANPGLGGCRAGWTYHPTMEDSEWQSVPVEMRPKTGKLQRGR
jgi:hypothetical protein